MKTHYYRLLPLILAIPSSFLGGAESVSADIIADPNATGQQRATVLNTANGLPLVNIQTPSAAGVSHNLYRQFDVKQKGAILNNSRTNAQTQLGGWVPANPWLATGSARVILNEVNSNNLSLLQGYIEVAGSKAQVIIANPAGVTCDGCGFINTNRATLTTGTPILNGGSLEAYRVQKGQISIEGKGLDARQTNYTDLIARAVKVNAGIWANDLKITTGSNQINAAHSQISKQPPTTTAPNVAIDVGTLGGMYAGKIRLIGTESGVGVHNAGQIGAGSLSLNTNGYLDNSGSLNSTEKMTISSQQGINNSGIIYTKASAQLTTQGDINNTNVIAALDDATLIASGANSQISGTTNAIFAAGLNTNGTLQVASSNANLSLKASKAITSHGQHLAAYQQTHLSKAIDLSSSQTSAHSLHIAASEDTVNVHDASINALDTLTITTPKTIISDNATISAKKLSLTATQLSNRNGELIQTGSDDLTLNVTGTLDNHQGRIASNSQNMNIEAVTLINTAGDITHAGDGQLQLTATQLDGTAGSVQSNGQLSITADTVILDEAQTNAEQISLNANTFSHRNGELIQTGSDALTLNVNDTLNNQQGLITSNGNMMVTAYEMDNRTGLIQSTGTTDIALNITTTLNNSETGQIQSGRDTAIEAASLNNQTGDIKSAEKLDLITEHEINNQQGQLTANDNLSLRADQINNKEGTINAILGGATVHTSDDGIDNTRGILASARDMSINTQALINDAGLIQTADSLQIDTHGHTLTNTQSGTEQGILSQGTIDLSTGLLTNQTGFIGSKGRIAAQSTDINNAHGTITSYDAVQLTAATLNNQGGQIESIGNIGIELSSNVDNQTGLIRSNNDIELTATDINNSNTQATDQGIEADTINLSTNTLDNRIGSITSNTTLDISARDTLNNSQGTLSSGHTLSIHDPLATIGSHSADKNLKVVNTKGKVIANQLVTIDSANLTGDGDILSGGDLHATLETDYINAINSRVEANNNLTLDTMADIINNGEIRAGQDLNLKSTNLTNKAAAEISGSNTNVIAKDTLTNRGLINGNTTFLSATTVNNLGTGRIYGDHLAIAANTLNNAAETINGTTKSAVIAAREELDLGIDSLNNEQHALIFSAGDIHIGGTLDSDYQANGRATTVINNGASIEALGNLTGSVDNLHNLNAKIVTQEVDGTTVYQGRIQPRNSTKDYDVTNCSGIGGSQDKNHCIVHPEVYGLRSAILPARTETSAWLGEFPLLTYTTVIKINYNWDSPVFPQFGVTPVQTPPLAPAGGCTTTINGNAYPFTPTTVNIDSPACNQYRGDYANWDAGYQHSLDQLDIAIAPFNAEINEDNRVVTFEDYTWKKTNATTSHTEIVSTDPASITAGGNINLTGNLTNKDSSIIAGNELNVTGGSVNNSATQGQDVTRYSNGTAQFTQVKSSGLFGGHKRKWYAASPYNPADEFGTPYDLDTLTYKAHTIANGSGTQTVAVKQTNISQTASDIDTVTPILNTNTLDLKTQNSRITPINPNHSLKATGPNQNNTLSLPTNSLFQVNPNAPQGYLIATDPSFTNYRHWISSDYMLRALSYDPALTQKRLGDGFYEQRLIREQIAQLTGRRFIEGYSSDDEQYKALMENGVSIAKEWKLRPGIALSPTQIAQLTSDIVWLVERTITLSDGTTQSVLVPQVYVTLKEGDLASTGALLAGQAIDLNLSGDLHNSGSLTGQDLVTINSDTINNLGGRIHANTVLLNAKTDINNLGGTISAKDALIAKAGRDINIITTTRDSHNGIDSPNTSHFSRTGIERVAGLYVSGNAGELLLQAKRNLSLIAANINNEGEQGTTRLSAGQDLTIGTVTIGKQEDIIWDKDNHLIQGNSQEIGTTIQTKGDIELNAGRDISLTASTVESEAGAIVLNAAKSITLAEGHATSNWDEAHKSTSSGLLSKKTSISRNTIDQSNSIGSSLSAENITLNAGKDITIKGSDTVATHDVKLIAQQDINIDTAKQSYEETHYNKKKRSGLSISSSGISIGSTKANGDDILRNTALASTVMSTHGNVTLDTGHDTNIIGSHLQAALNTTITAERDVNITSDQTFFDEQHWQKESNTGLSWSSDENSVSLFAGTKKIKVTDTALGNNVAASQIEAGTDVNITAQRNINQLSSDVLAGRDINYTAENITVIAAQNTLKTSHIVEQSSNGLGVSIQHNLGSTIDAINNSGKGEDATSKGSNTLAAVDAVSSFAQGPSVSLHLGNTESRDEVTQNEHLAQGAVLVAQRDVNFNAIKDITLAGAEVHAGRDINLNAKDINILAAQNVRETDINSDSSSSGFVIRGGGNTVSVGVAHSEATSDYTADGTQVAMASLNAGQDITATAEQDIHIAGTQINAQRDISLTAGRDTLIESAHNSQQSDLDENSQHSGAGVAITVGSGGASFGVYGEVGFSKNDLERDGTSHTDSQLNAGNIIAIDSGRDTTIVGAQLEAGDIDIKTERNLTVSSQQDMGQAEGKRMDLDVSATVGIGYSGNISAGYGETEGEKAWVEEQTSIIGRNSVTIDTQKHTQIDGALIANRKADGRDGGNLTLATNTLGHRDFSDIDKESTDYLNVSFGISKQKSNSNASAGTGNGLRSEGGVTAQGQQEDGSASTSYGIKGESYDKDRQQITRATVGEGTITVRNDSDSQNSTEGLNRDIDTAQERLKDEESTTTLYATSSSINAVANPAETVKRWKDDVTNLPKVIQALPETTRNSLIALADETVNLVRALFPEGLSGEQQTALYRAALEKNDVVLRALIAAIKDKGLDERQLQLVDDYFEQNISGKALFVGLEDENVQNAIFQNLGAGIDGTQNNRKVDLATGSETNVAILEAMYKEDSTDDAEYFQGVATGVDFGFLDKYVCGYAGCGSGRQMDDVIQFLFDTWDKESIIAIDLMGFSRGAGTVRTLANKILKEGIPGVPMEMIWIRSEILFDTVGSTGLLAGNNIDLGHDFSTSDKIGTIIHATAEHEYRNLFDLQSVRYADGTLPNNAEETSYPGAHADNAGGYKPGEDGKSNQLSNIVLKDIHAKAKDLGIPLAAIPEQYQVSPELEALYNNYRQAQSDYRASPTELTKAFYQQAYDNLAKDYIHDSRPAWKQSGIFEDLERDIFYPNTQD